MHRYLFGIVLVQLVSVVVLWINAGVEIRWSTEQLLKVVVPLALLALTTALWFDTIARAAAASTLMKLREAHAREREQLQIRSEQEKTRVVKDAHRELHKQTRRAQGRANRRVALAYVAVAGAAVLMLTTQLVTIGMMLLLTATGALGGYLYRGRRESALTSAPDPRVIESPELPRRLDLPETPGQSSTDLLESAEDRR